ncbi:MAG: glucosyl-3-phosphoglycerate synthase [Mycobacteriales bacterium]
MRPDVCRWFERRSYPAPRVSAAQLVASKGGQTVSVVLPALNEAATIGPIVAAVVDNLMGHLPLVDEVVVVDPGSTDGTAEIAAAAGAVVVAEASILPGHGRRPGKGEALWKSLFVTRGDLLVFIDADLTDFRPAFVTGLLTPLLCDPDVAFVKACYDRPLSHPDGSVSPAAGGRVTELVARPLLDLLWPQLAGVVQPLAGEYAGRRSLLESLPFASGYAVELALLVDAVAAVGLDGLAQVDLGSRSHRNQPDAALGRMAAAIVATALGRAGVEPAGLALTQFVRDATGSFAPEVTPVLRDERPPMRAVAEYAARHARAS